MSLFRKIFGKKSDDDQEHIKNDERSKYMPEIKLPVRRAFYYKF